MIAGFFGKLPASGDFVTRRLPPAFVQVWDRWVARHLAPRFGPDDPALCFLLAVDPCPATTGLVLPSRDRAGRPYPLTLAAPLPANRVARPAQSWFADLDTIGRAALHGRLDPDHLAARLATLPCPPPAGASVTGLLLWRDPAAIHAADPEAPAPVLDRLLARRREAL